MVLIDDPFFLRDLVEGTDYWWVDLNKMSEAYLPHLERIKEAKRAAEEEAADGVAKEAFAAAAKKAKANETSAIWLHWQLVTEGVSKGEKGWVFECTPAEVPATQRTPHQRYTYSGMF